MPIFDSLRRFAAEYRAARAEIRTEELIRALPTEIQRDIGWPVNGMLRDSRRLTGSRRNLS